MGKRGQNHPTIRRTHVANSKQAREQMGTIGGENENTYDYIETYRDAIWKIPMKLTQNYPPVDQKLRKQEEKKSKRHTKLCSSERATVYHERRKAAARKREDYETFEKNHCKTLRNEIEYDDMRSAEDENSYKSYK